ncbi:3653_t:CDS:2, partial [Rhizophagus irregularis]
MSTLTLSCIVQKPALENQGHFKINIDANKTGYDLKKLICENINILDVDIRVWIVKISFSGKENLQNIEIKDENSVGDIFKQVENNSYILLVQVCRKNLSYPRTTSVMHQEEYAEQLGEREIQPIQDLKQLSKLMIAREAFLNKLKEEGKDPMAFIGPGLVDDKPAIIVVFPDETVQIRLPATFEGYPVFIRYGVVEPASNPRAYNKKLKPGISIGCSEVKNAFTLGAFFQTDTKKFILTAGHAVGEVCSVVVQPGKYENDPDTSSCAKVSYKFHGIGENSNLLDYSFCEIEHHDRVPVVDPNKPFGSETVIRDYKDFVSDDSESMTYVYKFGRTSFLTKGVAIDKMLTFCTKKFGRVSKVSALLISSIDGQPFGEHGDSGSAVYDDD